MYPPDSMTPPAVVRRNQPAAGSSVHVCWIRSATSGSPFQERGRDLLCVPCADSNYPARVVLFPPLGIYRLTERRLDLGKHGKPKPQLPPDPGPHPPKPTPKSPPGTPPV